ncbi:FadR family transcriptional regulator [Phreatobacter aquaticus]|uniref:FadR family transcriptional regulator n=1 Tax=Phreatobacter aquaticus TaxID=2570229 RepID=A0A4D7QLL0_9HYPH|nr:GntR family transcriptional regulator [Phreatobacter aquaticus]QCK87441.1 FadR family transcriptional regulator [Phreatobacter aquaticus]
MFEPLRPQGGPEEVSTRAKSDSDGQAIYQSLSGSIAGGHLRSGARLPTERALASRFGAARNTVRRTMNRLAAEGLIIRHVGRGTFVAPDVKPQETATDEPQFSLGELLEARLMFEPMLAELVAERASDETLAGLPSYLEALRRATSWIEFKEAKYALHLAIVRASGNSFLVAMFETIIAARREAAAKDNEAIVDALVRRDTEVARELIRTYLLRTLMSVGGS